MIPSNDLPRFSHRWWTFPVTLICLPFFLISFGAFAQYGPFGMGNSTGEDNQPKLLVWLDASKLSATDGSNVSVWTDLSGNGNDFTAQGSGPIMRTTEGPNGMPALQFVNDRMVLENLEFTNQGVSIFYVMKSTDVRYGIFSFAESNENPYKVLVQQHTSKTRLTVDGAEHETTIDNLANNVWRYGGLIWDGGDPTYWHRSNGTGAPESTQNAVLVGKSNVGSGTAVIGHIQHALDGGYDPDDAFTGYLAEVIVYDGKIGKAHLRMINTYFRTKYLVGGASNWDKFKTENNFRTGPIGIGRDNGSSTEHIHSERDGLVLLSNPNALLGSHSYLSGAHDGTANSVTTDNLPVDVEARWNRTWFINKDGMGAGTQVQIGFDFGEGIDGDYPTNPSEYVLLYRSGPSGVMSVKTVQETSVAGDQVRFRLSDSQVTKGYYTLGSRNQLVSSLTGAEMRTWHAYTSGNWSDPNTWTLDGSAAPYYINPDGEVPSAGDVVYIGSGRVVTADIPTSLASLILNGTLDLQDQPNHAYNTLSGNGLLRCAGHSGQSNFPLGNTTEFSDPVNGGRVEFYGPGFVQSQAIEVNRLKIDLDDETDEIVLAADLIHNGRLEVEKGTFRINDGTNTARTITSNGDVWVGANGRVFVSASGSAHNQWNVFADLHNDGGQIRLTNRTPPATSTHYTTTENTQRVSLAFRSEIRNQSLLANGETRLSRILINKGVDDTYVLSISAENPGDFHLLGYCGNATGADSPNIAESNSFFNNAFALVNGTAEIGQNVFIPLNTGGNYNLNESTTLWVNGGTVAKGAPQVGTSNTLAVVVYGTVKVSEGTFYANVESGFTLRGNGTLQIDGGEVYANQIRTSTLSAEHIGGLIINGGLVHLDGTRPGGVQGSYYTLSLTFPGNVFRMSGGILRVAGPSSKGLIYINSDPQATSVSGGTVIAEIKNTSGSHRITSRAPFWNLEIERTGGSTNAVQIVNGSSGSSGGVTSIPNLPLYIQNNLTIGEDAILDMNGSADNDLYVRGDFTIEEDGAYNHHNNTTYLHGNANSRLMLPDNATPTFHNLVIDKAEDSRYAEIIEGNSTAAFRVLSDFRLERGSFENNTFDVSLRGDAVVRSTIGGSGATGTVVFDGANAQTVESDNGAIRNLSIDNANGVTLTGGMLTVNRKFELADGNFHLGPNRLRIASQDGYFHTSGTYGPSRCLTTDGSASAGGLQMICNSAAEYDFHVGVKEGASVKYTPATIKINGGFDGPGFMAVTPVNSKLETVDDDGGEPYLNFFWRVTSDAFDSPPSVSYRFRYDPADVTGTEADLASGRVLLNDPFSREVDFQATEEDHVDITLKDIYFNGGGQGAQMNGSGIPLVDADYTAGNPLRFVGQPKVYFSRSTDYGADWNVSENWNELSAFGPEDGPYDWHGTDVAHATSYPQNGDIAFIGFGGDGRPHVYDYPAYGVRLARVEFTPLQDASENPLPRWTPTSAAELTRLRPTLLVSGSSSISAINQIVGEGALLLSVNADLTQTDIFDFLSRDSSIVILQPPSGAITFTGLPSEVPNLFVTAGNNGTTQSTSTINSNLVVRNDLEVIGNARLNLSTGIAGDLLVKGDVILDKYLAGSSSPQILFGNTGTPRTVDVRGDVFIRGNGARIGVPNPNMTWPHLVHEFIAHKNIYQDAPASTGLDFFTPTGSDFIKLTLRGDGNHSFVNTAGNHPKLGLLTVDKGSDLNSSFSFNSKIEILGPTDQAEKAIDLENGLLIIDDGDIDITLATGGGDFVIPASAGLQLNDGTLRIEGLNLGLLLDGRLEINGGLFEIGNAPDENNYLQYSSGGSSELEINGGVLRVGSQIRRGLTNSDGILKYTQTGGEVFVGVSSAPETNRGVFEIVNDGSRFDFTGGKLTLVRGINSPNVPSLNLDPTFSNVTGTGELVIGHADSPSGPQISNIGIRTSIELGSLEINNDSENNPVVTLYSTPLTLNDDLTIDEGASLICGLPDLTLRGNVLNDGILNASSNHLVIEHESAGTIQGEGVFTLGNFSRTGGGHTTVYADLEILNDFSLDGGEMDFDAYRIVVRGSATVDGSMYFSDGSEGLTLAGGAGQQLKRTEGGTSHIDVLTTDNPMGIGMVTGAGHMFVIGRDLRMKRGILNLGGNLLELGSGAEIVQVNAFGKNNMINTGGAFTNFGVKKIVPANSNSDILMPLGLTEYLPMRLNFSDTELDFTSGTTESTYVFRVYEGRHAIIVNDTEEAPDPEIIDTENVLQMYFTLEAENVTDAKLTAEFQYHEAYVETTDPHTEEDYVGARVVDNSPTPDVYKFPGDVFPEMHRIILDFTDVDEGGITGDYFAGVTYAIPDNVPVFETDRSGDVDEGGEDGTYNQVVPGGSAPNGAVVHIRDGHTLTLNVNGVNFYKTIIDSVGVLNIEGTSMHRLGIVEGTGTIRVVNTSDLPAATYNDFFTCQGGKLEYAGTSNFSVLGNIPVVRQVSFTGSGNRVLPNNDVTVCENVIVNGPNLLNESARKFTVQNDMIIDGGMVHMLQGDLDLLGDLLLNDGTFIATNAGTRKIFGDAILSGGTFNVGTGSQVQLMGDMTKTSGVFQGGSSTSRFIFIGEQPQTLTGDFTDGQEFHRLELDNAAGLTIDGSVDVKNALYLTDGLLHTGPDADLLLTKASVTVEGAGPGSFVNGPLHWNLDSNYGAERRFPVGKADRYRPLTLRDRTPTQPRVWTVEYFGESPMAAPEVDNLLPANPFEIKTVSKQEHWRVNSNSNESTTARVGLSWGENSVVAPDPADYQKLVVMEYDEEADYWINRDAVNSSFSYDVEHGIGTFRANVVSSFSERIFTLGSEDAINPLPVTWLYFAGRTENGKHILSWATASELNADRFAVERSIDGRLWSRIGSVEASGNSNREVQYGFVDVHPPAGRVYYRLIQYDFDGNYELSPDIVTLQLQVSREAGFDFVIFPNPTDSRFNLLVEDFADEVAVLSIYDLSGRKVYDRILHVIESGVTSTVEANLDPGVYVVRVISGSRQKTKPLVVR